MKRNERGTRFRYGWFQLLKWYQEYLCFPLFGLAFLWVDSILGERISLWGGKMTSSACNSIYIICPNPFPESVPFKLQQKSKDWLSFGGLSHVPIPKPSRERDHDDVIVLWIKLHLKPPLDLFITCWSHLWSKNAGIVSHHTDCKIQYVLWYLNSIYFFFLIHDQLDIRQSSMTGHSQPSGASILFPRSFNRWAKICLSTSVFMRQIVNVCVWAQLLSCIWLFVTPMNCTPPGSSIHGIF